MATGLTPSSSSASITAMWASPRAPPPPSASASVLGLWAEATVRRPPARTPTPPAPAAAPAARAPDDALQDRGDAEEIVGHVGRQMRARIEPGALDVAIDIGVARGNAERGEILPAQRGGTGTVERRHLPLHQMIVEIRERIAERRKLPVEHGEDPRLGLVQHHVVEPIVAVHDCDRARRRHVRRQPLHQLVHLLDLLGFRGAVLLRPAVDLARDVIFALAEVAEPDLGGLE